MIVVIQKSLIEILNSDDKSAKLDVMALRKQIECPNFIIALLSGEYLLQNVTRLAIILQTKSLDVFRAQKESSELIKNLKKFTRTGETFREIYFRATAIMNDLGFSITRNVNELGSKSKLDIYHQYIFKPMIDSFLADFESRLSKREESASNLFKLHPKHLEIISDDDIRNICRQYCSLISQKEPESCYVDLRQEIKHLKEFYIREENINSMRLMDIYKRLPEYFSLCRQLFQIMLTLPVSNATGERGCSALSRIKTKLRNTMLEERLSAIARVHMCNHIEVSTEEIIEKFASKSRRLDFNININN